MTERLDPAQTVRSTHHAFHSLIVVGLVGVLGIFFALTLDVNKSVSELENRRLASWPALTSESLLDGSYSRDIEKYVADHFPVRGWFTEVAFAIRAYRGFHTGDRVIQVKGADTGFEDVSQWASVTDTPALKETVQAQEATEPNSSEATNKPVSTEIALVNTTAFTEQPAKTPPSNLNADQDKDLDSATSPQVLTPVLSAPVEIKPSATNPVTVETTPAKPTAAKQLPPLEATQTKPLNVVGGVLLHEGQALFMFQGTDRGAQGYANAVNTWVDLVANKRPGMTTTVVVTPTSSHFYLPPAARARTTSEPKNLAALRAALLPEVRFADVVSEMEGHQDKALFFKSDHHWTGLGAFYAYRAWAKANGVTPLELSSFSKRSVPGVAGSFWSLTQAPELRNADKESYYYVPTTVTFDGTQYTGPQQKSPVAQPFFAEKSRGYIVFLGGDIPLLVSNTSAGTGRTALVVKNSYGNAFAPYLLPHFDRVVVLDYRYVSRNIQDIVDTFGVTDLVFVNATITANSGAHQERMRQVARGTSTAWLTEAEKRNIKQQEDAAAKSQTSTTASNAAQ